MPPPRGLGCWGTPAARWTGATTRAPWALGDNTHHRVANRLSASAAARSGRRVVASPRRGRAVIRRAPDADPHRRDDRPRRRSCPLETAARTDLLERADPAASFAPHRAS